MNYQHPRTEDIRLEMVLSALGSPIRLAVLRVLSDFDEHSCGGMLPNLPRSTKTHHFRILRESGVVWQRQVGRDFYLLLRQKDLEARFPGLLKSVLRTLTRDAPTEGALREYL
ncbi:helix-turn-helix transcriptional regulator [Caballeronia sp. J97]|uniref:ArsR/SmtB family transcription factor n=1 Tax=Caballeronia sp. J97 TaxID=2805429 RepID=UPI002AB2706E|nr:helix-turn-helix transcriptional regulator [Caballeronia sp. J97]